MADRRTIAWFSAFVIVVMLIGVASGILLDRFLLRPPPDRFARAFGPGPGAMRRVGGLNERLTQELELSAAQTGQVGAILGRRRAKLDEIRGEMQGRMQKEQADIRAEIRSVLTEKQQKRFDEVMANAPGLGGIGPGQRGMRRGGAPGRQE